MGPGASPFSVFSRFFFGGLCKIPVGDLCKLDPPPPPSQNLQNYREGIAAISEGGPYIQTLFAKNLCVGHICKNSESQTCKKSEGQNCKNSGVSKQQKVWGSNLQKV